MIKVDIVNEVSKIADITKVKAEVAVDAVFDAMRALHAAGRPDRASWLRRVPGEAAEARHRPQPADRQGSSHPARPDHPVQARQRPPEYRVTARMGFASSNPPEYVLASSCRTAPRAVVRPAPRPRRWRHIILFLLTVATTMLVGAEHFASFSARLRQPQP